MMHPHEVVLRIIATRSWKNGALQELAEKALRGEPITREDTDLTEKDWEKKIKAPGR